MKVYVIGAGVSKDVGYPLGANLLSYVDSFVRSSGNCFVRFDYSKDWPRICQWLGSNENLYIRRAYQTRNFENIFTALDFAEQLWIQSELEVARNIFDPAPDMAVASTAQADHSAFSLEIAKYREARQILLWALEHFLEYRHHDDRSAYRRADWDYLRSFGNKLSAGDVVITFNYDATIERVLSSQGKWFPGNGYGFEVVFQKSRYDETRISYPDSPVKILHLHGSTGWYRKPEIKHPELLPPGGGSFPLEARTPAPLETQIGLDPIYLSDLGISAVDASLPIRPTREDQIFLHPSFFKNYERDGGQNRVFIELWKRAAECLRNADLTSIIGYSLPEADSAALTLFVTSCVSEKVQIVNPDRATHFRFRQIIRPRKPVGRSFSERVWAPEDCFKDWIAKLPNSYH